MAVSHEAVMRKRLINDIWLASPNHNHGGKVKMGGNQNENMDTKKAIKKIDYKIAAKKTGRVLGGLVMLGATAMFAYGGYWMSKQVNIPFNNAPALVQASESLSAYSGSKPVEALGEARDTLESVSAENPAYATRFSELEKGIDNALIGGVEDDSRAVYGPLFESISEDMDYLTKVNDPDSTFKGVSVGLYVMGAIAALNAVNLLAVDGERIGNLKKERANLEKLVKPE